MRAAFPLGKVFAKKNFSQQDLEDRQDLLFLLTDFLFLFFLGPTLRG